MTLYTLFTVLDWAIFIVVAFSVIYFLFFVIASKFYHNNRYPESENYNKILVLFPAYQEDTVIVSSAKKFLIGLSERPV